MLPQQEGLDHNFDSQPILDLFVQEAFQAKQILLVKHGGDFVYQNLYQKSLKISGQQVLGQYAKYAYKYLLHYAGVPNQLPANPDLIYLAACDGLYKDNELNSFIGDLSVLEQRQEDALAKALLAIKPLLKKALKDLKSKKQETDDLPEVIMLLLMVAKEKVRLFVDPGNHESLAKGPNKATKKALRVFYDSFDSANDYLNRLRYGPYNQSNKTQRTISDGLESLIVEEKEEEKVFYLQAMHSGEIFYVDGKALGFIIDTSWPENFVDPKQIMRLRDYLVWCYKHDVEPHIFGHHGMKDGIGRRALVEHAETSILFGCFGPHGPVLASCVQFDSKYYTKVSGSYAQQLQQSITPLSYAALLPHLFRHMFQSAIDLLPIEIGEGSLNSYLNSIGIANENLTAYKMKHRSVCDNFLQSSQGEGVARVQMLDFLNKKGIHQIAGHQHAADRNKINIHLTAKNPAEEGVGYSNEESHQYSIEWTVETVQSGGLFTKHLKETGVKYVPEKEDDPQDPRKIMHAFDINRHQCIIFQDGVELIEEECSKANVELYKKGYNLLEKAVIEDLKQFYSLILHMNKLLDPAFVLPRSAVEVRRIILSVGSPTSTTVAIDGLFFSNNPENPTVKGFGLLRAAVLSPQWDEVAQALLNILSAHGDDLENPIVQLPPLNAQNRAEFKRALHKLTQLRFIGPMPTAAKWLMALPIRQVLLPLFLMYLQTHLIKLYLCMILSGESCVVTTFPNGSHYAGEISGNVSSELYDDILLSPLISTAIIISLIILMYFSGCSSRTMFRIDEDKPKGRTPVAMLAFILDAIFAFPPEAVQLVFCFIFFTLGFGVSDMDRLGTVLLSALGVRVVTHITKHIFAGPDMRDKIPGKTLYHFLETHRTGKMCCHHPSVLYVFWSEQMLRRGLYNATLSTLMIGFWQANGGDPSVTFLAGILAVCIIISCVMSGISMVPTVGAKIFVEFAGSLVTNLLELMVAYCFLISDILQLINPAMYQGPLAGDPYYAWGAAAFSIITVLLIAQYGYACAKMKPAMPNAMTVAESLKTAVVKAPKAVRSVANSTASLAASASRKATQCLPCCREKIASKVKGRTEAYVPTQ